MVEETPVRVGIMKRLFKGLFKGLFGEKESKALREFDECLMEIRNTSEGGLTISQAQRFIESLIVMREEQDRVEHSLNRAAFFLYICIFLIVVSVFICLAVIGMGSC